jgi:hypothetical protein
VAVTFSQQFCSLVRCGAGGRIVAGPRARNCLVQVADGKLVITALPRAMRLGRELAREFTTALLTAGAVSHTETSSVT